ncbi:hypothetical protein [Parabacteroides merdae]|uniref:hypothetical protein n=1 Tax=Parabacteroides merdae TaxID=46503 RepID=UPI0022E4CCA8|nr:hypothetical protein [Parabacteroides merdae]
MCNNKGSETNIIKIHFIYVVFILVVIIIVLLSCRLSDNQSFVDIVSFAGTLTSIILSVLAIFITVLSNDSFSNLMEKIRGLTDSINPLKIKIDESSDKMKDTIGELNKTNQELKNSSQDINKVIQNLEKNICNQVKGIENKMDKLLSPSNDLTSTHYMENCDANVDYFVESTSVLGLQVLYCCALYEKSKKNLYLSRYCSYIGSSLDDIYYVWGFLVAAKSAGYIDFIIKGNGYNLIFKDIKCNPLLTVDKIKKGLQQKLNSTKDESGIKKIEDFCNEEETLLL